MLSISLIPSIVIEMNILLLDGLLSSLDKFFSLRICKYTILSKPIFKIFFLKDCKSVFLKQPPNIFLSISVSFDCYNWF